MKKLQKTIFHGGYLKMVQNFFVFVRHKGRLISPQLLCCVPCRGASPLLAASLRARPYLPWTTTAAHLTPCICSKLGW